MRTLTIGFNDAGQRLDKFLKKTCTALPDSLLYKYLRKKCVKLNGAHCTDGAVILNEGDTLALYMRDEFFVPAERNFLTLKPDLSVAYEDEHLLVVEKPTGLSCHADDTQKEHTLIDFCKAYLYQKGEYDPENEQSFAPALCNRIDRNTKGLVLCAKTAPALRALSRMIRENRVEKEYRALVYGAPAPKSGTLTFYLEKEESRKTVRIFESPRPGAKTAITDYETLKTENGVSLVKIRLHTGRTHQIRASFAHIGCPLVGDSKYGDCRGRDTLGFSHQALFARSLTFRPNGTDAPLEYLDGVTVTASPDPRFA